MGTERYQLPAELGGAEVRDDDFRPDWLPDQYRVVRAHGVGRWYVILHRDALIQIPPPSPPEPDPGAYQAGSNVLLFRFPDGLDWFWADSISGTCGWLPWPKLMSVVLRPDVDIVPLVPKPDYSSICECERWRDGVMFCPVHGTHKSIDLPWKIGEAGDRPWSLEVEPATKPGWLFVSASVDRSGAGVKIDAETARTMAVALLSAADRAEVRDDT